MLARRGTPVAAAAPRGAITPANRQAFEEGVKQLPDFSDFKAGPSSSSMATGSVGGPFGGGGAAGGTVAAAPQALRPAAAAPQSSGVLARSPDSTPTGVLGRAAPASMAPPSSVAIPHIGLKPRAVPAQTGGTRVGVQSAMAG